MGQLGPFEASNKPWPLAWLGHCHQALQPEGKPLPRPKVFLLFERLSVPGSCPQKVPESAGSLHLRLPQKHPRGSGNCSERGG